MKFFRHTQFLVYIIFLLCIVLQIKGFDCLFYNDWGIMLSKLISMGCMLFTPLIFLCHFFINKINNQNTFNNIAKNICIINIFINFCYFISIIIGILFLLDFDNNGSTIKCFYSTPFLYILLNVFFILLLF